MAAIDDWVDVLSEFSQEKIQKACIDYLRREPSKRPTPAAISRLIKDTRTFIEKPQSEWTAKDRTAAAMQWI